MNKIKATYRSNKGYKRYKEYIEQQERDPAGSSLPDGSRYTWTCYKNVKDIFIAEKKVYDEMFQAELDLQNGKYRKKGNYGRIKTMQEWMLSSGHRPLENLYRVGNKNGFIAPEDLWQCYVEFHNWRNKVFGKNLWAVSAVLYMDRLYERYVLYWQDGNGIMHTGIDKSLKQAGVALPDASRPECRDNYRKKEFDRICREKWLDIVEKKLLDKYPELELDRTVREKKRQDSASLYESGSWRAYDGAWDRARKRVYRLQIEADRLQKRKEEIRNEKDELAKEITALEAAAHQDGADIEGLTKQWDDKKARGQELEMQERILKQKIKAMNKRLSAAEEKAEMLESKAI